MKFQTIILLGLMLTINAAFAAQSAEGSWYGVLRIQGTELPLLIQIRQTNGVFYSEMFSLAQGSQRLGGTFSYSDKDGYVCTFPMARATYKGIMSPSGDKMIGQLFQGMAFPLELTRTNLTITLNRPQEPKKPYPYTEINVEFENTDAKIRLAGTLTIPKGKGPFPAVVLVTGSGPQDRNEELMSHKPFLLLSDYLTRRGIAVLRYDDRGVGLSGGDFATATTQDFAGDALAAYRYLRTRKEIRSDRIGIAGHSEGGMVAPMVAAKDKSVAFIVLIAGPGAPCRDIMGFQMMYPFIGKNARSEMTNVYAKMTRECIDTLIATQDIDKAYHAAEKYLSSFTADEKKQYMLEPATLKQSLRVLNGKWFREFLAFKPDRYLKQVGCPVLALFGEKDMQVPAQMNYRPMLNALRKSKTKDYTVKILPKLNHLFQTAGTGMPDEYQSIEETIAPKALKTIGDWIIEKTK